MLLLIVFFTCSGTTTEAPTTPRPPSDAPEFEMPIVNLTVPVGREAVLSCTVDRLGKYKVSWMEALLHRMRSVTVGSGRSQLE